MVTPRPGQGVPDLAVWRATSVITGAWTSSRRGPWRSRSRARSTLVFGLPVDRAVQPGGPINIVGVSPSLHRITVQRTTAKQVEGRQALQTYGETGGLRASTLLPWFHPSLGAARHGRDPLRHRHEPPGHRAGAAGASARLERGSRYSAPHVMSDVLAELVLGLSSLQSFARTPASSRRGWLPPLSSQLNRRKPQAPPPRSRGHRLT